MEIIIDGVVKLTAEDANSRQGKQDTFIHIDVLGDFSKGVQPLPKVKASELKAAIDALEKSCWRLSAF